MANRPDSWISEHKRVEAARARGGEVGGAAEEELVGGQHNPQRRVLHVSQVRQRARPGAGGTEARREKERRHRRQLGRVGRVDAMHAEDEAGGAALSLLLLVRRERLLAAPQAEEAAGGGHGHARRQPLERWAGIPTLVAIRHIVARVVADERVGQRMTEPTPLAAHALRKACVPCADVPCPTPRAPGRWPGRRLCKPR